ncbi:MAG TPA: radical SAM protein, partial [Thermovirga lienii]|nr:radical SAM protein [Thermovirga lienii]
MEGVPKFVDTHCHLAMTELSEELCQVLERAQSQNVTGVLAVGSDEESGLISVDIANNHAGLV